MDALRENPEVLYGAVVAFVIVILLTPAVGGMARLLGVVDRPEGRRLNVNPVPRLGGAALVLRLLNPPLPRARPGDARGAARRGGRARRRRHRRLPRSRARAQARRPARRRLDPSL